MLNTESPAAAESSKDFWIGFNKEVELISSKIKATSLAAPEIQNIKKKISALQNYATSSTKVLPPYDIRRSQEIIELATKELAEVEKKCNPKKKFSFSSKNKAPSSSATATPATSSSSVTSIVTSVADKSSVASQSSLPSSSSSSSSSLAALEGDGRLSFTGLRDQSIFISEADIAQHLSATNLSTVNLFLKDCIRCTIRTECASLGSVRMEQLSSCVVLLGPFSTSAYLEGCGGCAVFVASHQLRIHNCSDCSMYVRCQSHPIIEDCRAMSFAPYTYTYPQIHDHIQAADLTSANCWDNVVDFRWHKATASPHWKVLPEAQRRDPCDLETLVVGQATETQAMQMEARRPPPGQEEPVSNVAHDGSSESNHIIDEDEI